MKRKAVTDEGTFLCSLTRSRWCDWDHTGECSWISAPQSGITTSDGGGSSQCESTVTLVSQHCSLHHSPVQSLIVHYTTIDRWGREGAVDCKGDKQCISVAYYSSM